MKVIIFPTPKTAPKSASTRYNELILERLRGIPANVGPANDPNEGGYPFVHAEDPNKSV